MPKPQKVYMFCLRLLLFFSTPPDDHLEMSKISKLFDVVGEN